MAGDSVRTGLRGAALPSGRNSSLPRPLQSSGVAKMNYLEKWAHDLLTKQSQQLSASVRVEGVRQAHLGPRLEVAKIEFIVEPADQFDVSVELPPMVSDPNRQWFVDSAIFGFLDVVMTA